MCLLAKTQENLIRINPMFFLFGSRLIFKEDMMSLVKLENVSKIYHTNAVEFPALEKVSFSIDNAEFLSIAGPSGSGKTTILNIIGCLDSPTSGTVLLDGSDISKKSSNELADIRRYNLGFIFQTFNH